MKQETDGGISFLNDSRPSRGASEPPFTTHTPFTIHPQTYPVQQYSNAEVRRATHLTGEQRPICWLQCSLAEGNLQLFPIPHHAGGQAKSARVADSAHGERRRLNAAVIGPGVVVLALDAGALVVSCLCLCPWLNWPKSISKVYYSLEFQKNNSGQPRRKRAKGVSEPSPGERFPRSPLAMMGHRRPFFRRHVVVLLCGWDVVAPRGRRRPSGDRELPLFLGGGVITKTFSIIQNIVTTTLAYYIIWI